MRSFLLFAALALVACGPDDDGRGTATAATTITTAASTGTGTGTTGDASTSGGTGSDATTTAPATSTTTSATTAVTTTGTSDGGTTTAAGMTTTTTASSTTGMEGVSCPPEGPMDCSPGPGSGEGDTCIDTAPCFRKAVQNAIQQVLAGHPEWFMHDDMGDFVLEVELYMNTVVELTAASGLCAIRDPNAGDEIAVKFNNEYAENFDILTAAGYVRYADGIYTSTCIPAWF